jgi:site-specific DNA recombinase
MKTIDIFNRFAKSPVNAVVKKTSLSNVVVYTRVSTKEQADKNLSLETQRSTIDNFIKRTNLNVVGYFGGTYESAKTDGRKEFKRMLDFIRKAKGNVNQVLVYTLDRFSRTGGEAIKLATDLREKFGITICAVTQPNDTTHLSGILNQNIQFLFSWFDNGQRKEKAVAGMKEKFKKGIWVVKPPMGYEIIKNKGERRIVVNEEGRKIRNAFEWKLQGVKNEEILVRLKTLGLNIYPQKLCKILVNPFYCGILSHGMLEGKVVDGVHEKLISKELFLKVNNVLKGSRYGIPHLRENDNLPLKTFVKCDKCGTSLTGYLVKKKKLYYYKCPKTGCNCSKSAKQLHSLFLDQLKPLTLTEGAEEAFITEFVQTISASNAERENAEKELKGKLTEVKKKIETIDEKHFALNEIPDETYHRLSEKFREEKNQIQAELQNSALDTSNLEKELNTILHYLSKPAVLWDNAQGNLKEKLQKLIFPQGIAFNKEKEAVQTSTVNDLFGRIALVSEFSRDMGGSDSPFFNSASPSAESEGFEPPDL